MGFWDDVGNFFKDAGEFVVDVFTGGVSREARESLDSVEDTSEKAGAAIGVIAATIQKLGDDLDSLIKDDIGPLVEDVGDLFAVERLTPRDESDLFEEEKERLEDLNDKKDTLKDQIDQLRDEIKDEKDVDIPGIYGVGLEVWIIQNVYSRSWFGGFSWDIFGIDWLEEDIWTKLEASGRAKVRKIQRMNSEIIKIEKEIHEILYNEPGVLPTTIYNAKEILERFNTIEQPKIEDIMDLVDDNLVESKEILVQVKKLFVIKKRIAIAESELSAAKLEKLKSLKYEYKILEASVTKDLKVAKQLMDLKAEIQPSSLNLSIAKQHLFDLNLNLKKDFESSKISDELRDAFKKKKYLLSPDAKISKAGDINWKISDDEKEYVIKESDNELKIYAKSVNLIKTGVLSNESPDNPTSKLKEIVSKYKTEPNVYKAAKQPPGLKIASGLIGKYSAYKGKHALQKAVIKLQEKDLSKLKLKIDKIKYKEVEEPGVIPRILAKFEDTLERFNTEEQPRIETILDSVNDNLTESKNAINKVNITFEKILGFVDNNNLLLKVFFAVVGVAVAVTLILIPVLIIRMILFGL